MWDKLSGNTSFGPSDHCWTILQDYGENGGGWGPAAVLIPGLVTPGPFVYTGDQPETIEALKQICRKMAQDTNRATKLVRYTKREDVFSVAGAS